MLQQQISPAKKIPTPPPQYHINVDQVLKLAKKMNSLLETTPEEQLKNRIE